MDYKDLRLSETPCREAIVYVRSQPDRESVWRNCKRGDWLFWWLGHIGAVYKGSKLHRLIVKAACDCGRLSLPNAGQWKEQLESVYSGLDAWCAGDDTQDLDALIASAESAVRSAAKSASWSAVWSAKSAVSAVWSANSAKNADLAESAVRGAVWSAKSASWIANWSAKSAARSATLLQCADKIRSILECPK